MADNDIIKQKKAEITSPQEELFKDACSIIEQAKAAPYRSVNEALIKRNWLLGLRIQHEVLKDQRAEYGEQIIQRLAEELTVIYGKGYIKRNLWHFVDFYVKYADLFYVVSGNSESNLIVNAVSSQLLPTETIIVNALRGELSNPLC